MHVHEWQWSILADHTCHKLERSGMPLLAKLCLALTQSPYKNEANKRDILKCHNDMSTHRCREAACAANALAASTADDAEGAALAGLPALGSGVASAASGPSKGTAATPKHRRASNSFSSR